MKQAFSASYSYLAAKMGSIAALRRHFRSFLRHAIKKYSSFLDTFELDTILFSASLTALLRLQLLL